MLRYRGSQFSRPQPACWTLTRLGQRCRAVPGHTDHRVCRSPTAAAVGWGRAGEAAGWTPAPQGHAGWAPARQPRGTATSGATPCSGSTPRRCPAETTPPRDETPVPGGESRHPGSRRDGGDPGARPHQPHPLSHGLRTRLPGCEHNCSAPARAKGDSFGRQSERPRGLAALPGPPGQRCSFNAAGIGRSQSAAAPAGRRMWTRGCGTHPFPPQTRSLQAHAPHPPPCCSCARGRGAKWLQLG